MNCLILKMDYGWHFKMVYRLQIQYDINILYYITVNIRYYEVSKATKKNYYLGIIENFVECNSIKWVLIC